MGKGLEEEKHVGPSSLVFAGAESGELARDSEPDHGGPVVHLKELEPDPAGDGRL